MDQINILGYRGTIESGSFGYYVNFKNHLATVNELAVKLGLKRKEFNYDWNIFSYPVCKKWHFEGHFFLNSKNEKIY